MFYYYYIYGIKNIILSICDISRLINAGEGGNEKGNSTMISGKVNLSAQNGTDKRLQIKVIPEAPCLQVSHSFKQVLMKQTQIKTFIYYLNI